MIKKLIKTQLKSTLKSKLKEERGSIFPLAIAVILSIFIIFAGVSEYLRLKLIASAVQEAVQSAVISVSTQNYDNNFSQTREGYSAGYKKIGGAWQEQFDTGDIYKKLEELLGLQVEGGQYVKRTGGEAEYKLSSLSTTIINSPFAPGSNEDVFEAESYIHLEVPLSFGWDHLPPLKIRLKVKSRYVAKF